MIDRSEFLYFYSISWLLILLVLATPSYAETPEETASRIAKEEQEKADVAKRNEERKAEEARREGEAKQKCSNNGGNWAKGKCVMPPDPQEKCEKNGGNWKRGKCIKLLPKPKPVPRQEAKVDSSAVVYHSLQEVVQKAVVDKGVDRFDPNLWFRDAHTGCLLWRNGENSDVTATWEGMCGSDGKAYGHGKATYTGIKSGAWSIIYCEFSHGKCEGQGINTKSDGSRYEGQFKDNNYNGNGVYVVPNVKKYTGGFKDNKYSGQGYIVFPSGQSYRGEFADGTYDGYGVYINTVNGEHYEGSFKNGHYNGQGVYTYPKGSKRSYYEGWFVNGKSNGYGKEYNADGSLYFEGQWVNDNPVGPSISGNDIKADSVPRLSGVTAYRPY